MASDYQDWERVALNSPNYPISDPRDNLDEKNVLNLVAQNGKKEDFATMHLLIISVVWNL